VILCADLASVDGDICDWNAAATGVPLGLAIPRADYGSAEDRVFDREWKRIPPGVVKGGFLFFRDSATAPEPAVQGHAIVKTLDDAGLRPGIDLPPCLDLEFPGGGPASGLTPKERLEHFGVVWQIVRDHYGVAPLVYTSERVWREEMGNPALLIPEMVESPLWLARYPYPKRVTGVRDPHVVDAIPLPPSPRPWGNQWWLHQYQGDAVRVPGFSATVDLSRFRVTKTGDAGDHVKWVQRRLFTDPAEWDGSFGPHTAAELARFQTAWKLTADGVIGPHTFARLAWTAPHKAYPRPA
jgi:hypothetical protein